MIIVLILLLKIELQIIFKKKGFKNYSSFSYLPEQLPLELA